MKNDNSIAHEENLRRFSQRTFYSSLSDEDLDRYFRIIGEGIAVNSHADLLKWLQGEIQYYLPHEIMLAVWYEDGGNHLGHDFVSALPGIRTAHLQSEDLLTLQKRLYGCWVGLGKASFRLSLGTHGFPTGGAESLCAFGEAMYGMRSLLVHGISDARGGQDCLYVMFSSAASFNNSTLAAIENLMPYLDTALRRVVPLDRQHEATPPPITHVPPRNGNYGLTAREVEILHWVSVGKTNAVIASLLEISVFTVKVHMQNIFKKLDVYNRIQAVAKAGSVIGNPESLNQDH
ncbi:MAG: XrtB/PEP-CTERM-associated transcriptional regulator EpsA [Nitrosospira sp.]